ncbi:MAG TPA: LpqN/LpqT family lipoprotein, partial [Mycobacterium sp.]|nr:LpqN/LpqT family lipoprotein [Mycobacterium sp.]
MPHRCAALAALLALVVSGCGTEVPDYQSIWSTSASTTAAPTTTGKPVPIAAYLEQVGVVGDPVAPEKLTDLTVTMPTPRGWKPYVNTNLTPGTRVIAKGDTYPTA